MSKRLSLRQTNPDTIQKYLGPKSKRISKLKKIRIFIQLPEDDCIEEIGSKNYARVYLHFKRRRKNREKNAGYVNPLIT